MRRFLKEIIFGEAPTEKEKDNDYDNQNLKKYDYDRYYTKDEESYNMNGI